MPLDVFIAMVAVGGIVLAIVCLVVLRFTLTRRLKKHLEASDAYWQSGTLDFGFLNTYIFAYACTLPFVSRSRNYQAIYKDLDIKAFATTFEIAAAYAMLAGFLVFFIGAPVFLLIS